MQMNIRFELKPKQRPKLAEEIAKAVVIADTLSPNGIQTRLVELQQELIKKANSKQDYDAIADEIFRFWEQKEKSEMDSHSWGEALNRIKDCRTSSASREPRSQNLMRIRSSGSSKRAPSSPTTSRSSSNPASASILQNKRASRPWEFAHRVSCSFFVMSSHFFS